MHIDLEPHDEGTILPVRAQAGARRSEVRGVQEGALKIAVTQVAEKGKANKSLVEMLCQALALRKSQVELIAGATSPHKRFLIRDMKLQELSARLEAVLNSSS